MGIYERYVAMNNFISLKLIVTLCCFLALVFFTNTALNILDSHASPITPEKNSTFSNSSKTNFNDIPVTTIIIPNEDSNKIQQTSSNNNDTSFTSQIDIDTINNTQNTNVSNIVPNNNNDSLSDPQQRGKYLVDDNGVHYYNINNCSEKEGSSGIGNMSECEDVEKEMSED
jgi:hypothetical protein